MKTALITGATSGIGKATAELFAKNNFRLIICGRRNDRLIKIKNNLSLLTEVEILNFDIKDWNATKNSFESLPDNFKNIDILINNAGNAHGLDTIQDGNIEDWDNMIDLNIKGLLYISKIVIPIMIKQNSGHIINLGSTAAKEVYPKGNVYCATKHAVDAINQGMRIDLNGYNIRVGAIHPGMVQTEFSEVRFKGDHERANQIYQNFRSLQPEDIADIIHFVVTRPYHVNIADLIVLSTDQATSTIVNRT